MVMSSQEIRRVVFGKVPMLFVADDKFPITDDQIQAASFDFRLGRSAHRMRSAALPHEESVADLIAKYRKFDFELDDRQGKYLEAGDTYIIPLLEGCSLPSGVGLEFTPKSSTGRVDVFCRVLADNVSHYDLLPAGYHGLLYLEVTPLSHDVKVQAGLSLVQGRFKTSGSMQLSGQEIERLHMQEGILFGADGQPLQPKDLRIVNDELYYHIDLAREVVGFVSKATTSPINMNLTNTYEPDDFWEPIRRPKDGQLVLLPGKFYLLATREKTRIPASVCGQVQAFKITTGEMRPHYAGFFDNGFGGETGTNGVLEVRSRDVPFRLVDGQPICAMIFERTSEIPDKLYKGNYTQSGPSLSKHFTSRYEAWTLDYWRSR